MGQPKNGARRKKLTELRREIIRKFLSTAKDNPGKFGDIGSTQWYHSLIGKLKEHNKRTGDVNNHDVMHWLHTSDLAPYYEEVKVSVVSASSSTQDAGATASTSGGRINSLQVANAAAVSEVPIPNGETKEEVVAGVSQPEAAVSTTGLELVPFVQPTCNRSETVNMNNRDLKLEEGINRHSELWRPWPTFKDLKNDAAQFAEALLPEGVADDAEGNRQQEDELFPQDMDVKMEDGILRISLPECSVATTFFVEPITWMVAVHPTDANETAPAALASSSSVTFTRAGIKTIHRLPAEKERSNSAAPSTTATEDMTVDI